MSLVIGLVLVAAIGWLVARPLLHPVAPADPAGAVADDLVLRLLAELEYDYRMGKIDADEYREQRVRLRGRDASPDQAAAPDEAAEEGTARR